MKREITNPSLLNGTSIVDLTMSAAWAFDTQEDLKDSLNIVGSAQDEWAGSFADATNTVLATGEAVQASLALTLVDEGHMAFHSKGTVDVYSDTQVNIMPFVAVRAAASADTQRIHFLNKFTSGYGDTTDGYQISCSWDDHLVRDLAGIGDDDQGLLFGFIVVNQTTNNSTIYNLVGSISVHSYEKPLTIANVCI